MKKLLLLTFTIAMFFANCTKDNSSEQLVSITENQQLTTKEKLDKYSSNSRSSYSCSPGYTELVSNYMNLYKGTPPEFYFDQNVFGDFYAEFDLEKGKLNELGFVNYTNNLHTEGKMSLEVKDLLVNSYLNVNSKTEIELETTDLRPDFIRLYNNRDLMNSDPLYSYVYNIVLELYNQYQRDGSEYRGGCGFKGFFADVMAGIVIGTGIGNAIAGATSWTVAGLAFSVIGPVVGGVVGAIVGIFTWDEDCECGKVTSLTIQPDNDCDLTRNVYASGAGSDVGGYEWNVTQNGVTSSFTTIVGLLGITQLSSSDPVIVTVRAICEDGMMSPFTKTFDLNVTDTSNPLGQVGLLNLSYSCAVEENSGNGNPYSCFMTGEPNGFYWVSSNHGSGNINYSYDISPNGMAQILEEDEQHLEILWISTGQATLTVTATNNCTGESTSSVQNINVPI